MTLRAAQLAEKIGATLQGDGSVELSGCAALDQAGPGDVSFLSNRKYAGQLKSTRAGAVVVAAADAGLADGQTLLIAADPYFAFRNALVALVGFRSHPDPGAESGISELASIAPTATLGKGCRISPFAVIADGATLGDRCILYPHTYVGPDARLGDDCVLFPSVTVYDRCVLGCRVTLHAGCVIGQDGFGYATHQGRHHKIPQTGNAVIEDDVEMGAGCTVDRATMGSTVVGAGTKFSNNVTIGHGTRIGRHNLLVAQVGVAGSVVTGDYVVMGGQTGVAGHLRIGDRVQLAGRTGVTADLKSDARYGNLPATPLTDAKRQMLALTRLPDLLADFRRLQKRVAELEVREGEPGGAERPCDSSQ